MNKCLLITVLFSILFFFSLPTLITALFSSLHISIVIWYVLSGLASIYFFYFFYFENYLKNKKQEMQFYLTKTKLEAENKTFKKQMDILDELVYRDALTSLWNKTYCYDRLMQEYKRIKRTNSHLSALYIDIDHFQAINDVYGENFGNDYLKSLSQLFKDTMRTSDIICRYESDEFIIILPDTQHVGAVAAAEKLSQKVKDLKCHADLNLSVSIGICSHGILHKNWIDIIFCAKNALKRAKIQGRDRIITSTNA